MQTSESIADLAKALAAAQSQMDGVSKDAVNPHFKRSYASLASVLDTVREPLAANGIAFYQGASAGDGGSIVVTTRLIHETGQWIESKLAAQPTKADPQGVGSCITYLRRYSLMAACGVAPDDDDGNGASVPVPQRQRNQNNGDQDMTKLWAPINQAVRTGVIGDDDVVAWAKVQGVSHPNSLTSKQVRDLADWIDRGAPTSELAPS